MPCIEKDYTHPGFKGIVISWYRKVKGIHLTTSPHSPPPTLCIRVTDLLYFFDKAKESCNTHLFWYSSTLTRPPIKPCKADDEWTCSYIPYTEASGRKWVLLLLSVVTSLLESNLHEPASTWTKKKKYTCQQPKNVSRQGKKELLNIVSALSFKYKLECIESCNSEKNTPNTIS